MVLWNRSIGCKKCKSLAPYKYPWAIACPTEDKSILLFLQDNLNEVSSGFTYLLPCHQNWPANISGEQKWMSPSIDPPLSPKATSICISQFHFKTALSLPTSVWVFLSVWASVCCRLTAIVQRLLCRGNYLLSWYSLCLSLPAIRKWQNVLLTWIDVPNSKHAIAFFKVAIFSGLSF